MNRVLRICSATETDARRTSVRRRLRKISQITVGLLAIVIVSRSTGQVQGSPPKNSTPCVRLLNNPTVTINQATGEGSADLDLRNRRRELHSPPSTDPNDLEARLLSPERYQGGCSVFVTKSDKNPTRLPHGVTLLGLLPGIRLRLHPCPETHVDRK
jgi:hypothetical protein